VLPGKGAERWVGGQGGTAGRLATSVLWLCRGEGHTGGDVRWALVSGQLSLNILCSLGQRGDLGLLRQAGFVSRPSTGTPARSARGIPQK
jgi:hypothetical protein